MVFGMSASRVGWGEFPQDEGVFAVCENIGVEFALKVVYVCVVREAEWKKIKYAHAPMVAPRRVCVPFA